MKYLESKAIGDAGEHFFAYKIARIFGWPCRLLDIDIGIDAQIEILDEYKNSTGQFLAIQIKTTETANATTVSIQQKHIEYWKTVETPVPLALVDITKRKIYWKSITTMEAIEQSNFVGKSSKIEFKSSDRISKKNVPMLRRLGFTKDIKQIQKLLEEVTSRSETILRQTADEDPELIEDFQHYINLMYSFRNLESKMHESKVLIKRIHKSVGDCGYTDTLDVLNDARSSLIDFLRDWNFDVHEGDEIKAFEKEVAEKVGHLDFDI